MSPAPLAPGTSSPLFLQGSTGTAVLVIHGFTSRPSSVAAWGEAIHADAHSVSVPLLPGHGTRWEDMDAVTAEDWVAAVETAYDALAADHERVVVAGLSMGGALALHLGAARTPALILVANPALTFGRRLAHAAPALRRVVRSTPSIGDDIAKGGVTENAYERTPTAAVAQLGRLMRRVRRELPGIQAPIVLFRSDEDHVVPDSSVRALLAGLNPAARARLRRVALHDSLHVATLDNDAGLIEQVSREEIAGLAPGAKP